MSSKLGMKLPKPLNSIEIKALIMQELVELLESKNGLTMSQHLVLIMRRCNNGLKECYIWTDTELLLVIQNYKRESREDPLYEKKENDDND